MADGIHEFTASGRQKTPSEEFICSWISQAWNDIPAEMITASFLKCGITNNLDGTQDDLVLRFSRGHAHDTKFFIILFERAFKMMKNGVYFILIALLVAELLKILIYAN